VLAPAEYGQIAILVAAATVLGSVISLGLEASVIRECVRLRDSPHERATFLNSIGWFTLVAPAVAAVIAWVAAVTFGGFGLRSEAILLAALSVAAQTTTTVFVGAALRADERLKDYLLLTLVTSVVTAALTIYFLFGVGAGPTGWFAGALGGGVAGAATGLLLLRHRWSRGISWVAVRGALLFGLPLLPHSLAHWVLNLSDRVILGAYVDDAVVGTYNLAYQAAAPIGLVLIAVHQGVMPLYPRAAGEGVLRARLTRIVTGHVHLGAWLGMAGALLIPTVILRFFPPAYAGAVAFVPWIAIGYVLFGLYLIPMDSMSLMVGRTRWLWIPTVLAAATNLIVNILFIPRFGAIAAAIATVAAYGVLLAGVILTRRRLAGPRIQYESALMLAGVAGVGGLGVIAMLVFPDPTDVAAVLGRVAAVVLAAGILLVVHLRRRGHEHEGDRQSVNATAAQLAGPEEGVRMAARGA
jgi:O-antigen/teichoic acid export membrane protein